MNVLDRLRSNEAFLALYTEGMSLLYQSGIFEFLREKGLPSIIGFGENVQILATQAARSAGYNEAINDMLKFKELYLESRAPQTLPKPEYGGVDRALNKGDLDEKELNAIRNGEPIDYDATRKSIIGTAGNPTAGKSTTN